MAAEVILDSSVIVALVTPETHSDWARKKMGQYSYFHILDFTYYEVADAVKSKQSDVFNAASAEEAYAQALKLMNLFGVHSFGEVVVDAMSVALEVNIAVYRAAFLVLAEKLHLRLLTLDAKLAKKLENTRFHGLIECPNL